MLTERWSKAKKREHDGGDDTRLNNAKKPRDTPCTSSASESGEKNTTSSHKDSIQNDKNSMKNTVDSPKQSVQQQKSQNDQSDEDGGGYKEDIMNVMTFHLTEGSFRPTAVNMVINYLKMPGSVSMCNYRMEEYASMLQFCDYYNITSPISSIKTEVENVSKKINSTDRLFECMQGVASLEDIPSFEPLAETVFNNCIAFTFDHVRDREKLRTFVTDNKDNIRHVFRLLDKMHFVSEDRCSPSYCPTSPTYFPIGYSQYSP